VDGWDELGHDKKGSKRNLQLPDQQSNASEAAVVNCRGRGRDPQLVEKAPAFYAIVDVR
jgi:hypothetical protein